MIGANGWIKVFRSLKQWEWYNDSAVFHLFIHLLLSANHQDGYWRGTFVKKSQLITGRKALSLETGISERTIRTSLKKLESTGELTIKTTNKYSIITICNYRKYQERESTIDQQNVQQIANKRPANDHKQEDKEVKDYIVEQKTLDCVKEIIGYLNVKANKNYKPETSANKKVINARLSEGHTMDDFKAAIDNQCRHWLGTNQEMYLRPATLFSPSKFEGYVNNTRKIEPTEWERKKLEKEKNQRLMDYDMVGVYGASVVSG